MRTTKKTIRLPKYPVTNFIVTDKLVCQYLGEEIVKFKMCESHDEAEIVRDEWVNQFWGNALN